LRSVRLSEAATRELAAPSVKQRLAALRHLFDWLVNGQVVPINPAHTVRGPRHVVTCGQTPVLDPAEARALLDSIPALVAAAGERASMRFLEFFAANIRNPHTRRAYARAAEEFFGWCANIGVRSIADVQPVHVATWNRCLNSCRLARSRADRADGLFVRADRRGARHGGRGCLHAEPPAVGAAAREGRQAPRDAVHYNLDEYLVAYLDGAGLRDDPKGPLFRTIGRGTEKLTRTVLPQANAYAMIRRRAAAAGIETKLGNHSFRATGITAYLKNGGTLEKAAAMANHASTRTTQLYDRRRDEVSLDEVERIVI
jgi:hypothetical protein